MTTRQHWTKESVVEAIRARSEKGLALNYQAAVKDDEPLTGAARRHFGSWNAALQAAGFDPVAIKREARSGPRRQRGSWTKEDVIEGIRRAAAEGQDLSAHRMQQWDPSLVATGQRLFGSWADALKAAGYAPDLIYRAHVWTDDEILERIRYLAKHGADLTDRTASGYDPSLYGAAGEHFGSWAAALERAGVPPERRTAKWSKSKVLEAIRNGRRDSVFRAIVKDYFPSWTAALREAGVPDDKAQKVGNRIRERREALGMSQGELGQLVGYTHRTISMLELGQLRDPRVSVALKLAKALKCSVEDIFYTEE